MITSSMAANRDGTLTMRGTVKPKVAGKTVRLQRKRCSDCPWSTVTSTKPRSNSTYSFRFSTPAGTRYYRALTPRDKGFLAGFSKTWKVRG